MRPVRAVLLVAAFLDTACFDPDPASAIDCATDAVCETGTTCSDGDCTPPCVTDAACDGTSFPTLHSIDGDSPSICPDADGSHCVSAGLVVGGSNLDGATFDLATPGGTVPLPARPNATAERVELDLPADIPTGPHTLQATNDHGIADQAFELIQGPPGPPGSDGSPDTAEQVLTKLQTVDGHGSGLDADTLDGSELADIEGSIAAVSTQVTTMAVPIGTIVGWHKSLDGVPSLPDGWEECNGQQIIDTDSPLYLTYLPDLNTEIFAGTGRGIYLRGGLESGVTNASTSFGPNNPTSNYAAGAGAFNGAAYHRIEDADNHIDAETYVNGDNAPVFRFQVAAMTVVWIIRVK